jgi:hypothetical protein
MNRMVRSSVVLFALLALAGAQVFGLQRGFLCECSGEAVETSYEYCHHVHGDMHAPCEEDHHEHEGTVPHDHEHENQGGSHEHKPLQVELNAASHGKDTSTSAVAPIPVLAPLAELPDFLAFLIAAPGDTATKEAPPPYLHSGGPPGIRETAKCMVLLI